MNNEIKQRWLSALRSGEYEQAKGALRRAKGGFCCLGVLCDLWLKEKGQEWQTEGFDPVDQVYFDLECPTCEGTGDLLPIEVQEWAGLSEMNPTLPAHKYSQQSIAGLNDSGWSFGEIANVIEAEL